MSANLGAFPASGMTKRTIVALALLSITPVVAVAQTDDRAAVRQAALDYVTAVLRIAARADRAQRVARPHQHGFMRQKDGTYRRGAMTYRELLAVAKEWNADRKRDMSLKEVIVRDAFDQTATAMVRAAWGIDFMQLAKMDGQWKILNIVWQSHLPATKTQY